jgi:hypothetical protein
VADVDALDRPGWRRRGLGGWTAGAATEASVPSSEASIIAVSEVEARRQERGEAMVSTD